MNLLKWISAGNHALSYHLMIHKKSEKNAKKMAADEKNRQINDNWTGIQRNGYEFGAPKDSPATLSPAGSTTLSSSGELLTSLFIAPCILIILLKNKRDQMKSIILFYKYITIPQPKKIMVWQKSSAND